MLTNTDYLMAWSIYLLSAAALMLTAWRITAPFWNWVKDPLRVIVAVLLLTPASVDPQRPFMAPALFVVAFELLGAKDGGIGTMLGIRLLLILIFAVLAVWLLRALWYWLVAAPRRQATQPLPLATQRAQPPAGARRPHGAGKQRSR